MEGKAPKISVAMASYNGENYIYEQIKTILNNLKKNDELIISDDGSTDKTIDIINSFKDERIKLLNGPRIGIKQNFANAIKNTTGDFIFLTDQDDIWENNKVEKIIQCFEKNDYILIQHDAIVIDENENIMFESFASHRNVKIGIIKNIIKNSYHGCCIAFKKELKEEFLPIPNDIYLHDQWIGLIGEVNGKTYFLDEKLMKYRRHGGNASSFKHLPIRQIIKNRLSISKELMKYLIKRKRNQKKL